MTKLSHLGQVRAHPEVTMSQDAVERVLGRLINDDGNSKAIKDSLADTKRAVQKGEEVVRVESLDVMKLLNVNK